MMVSAWEWAREENVPVFKGSRPLDQIYGRFLWKEEKKFTVMGMWLFLKYEEEDELNSRDYWLNRKKLPESHKLVLLR